MLRDKIIKLGDYLSCHSKLIFIIKDSFSHCLVGKNRPDKDTFLLDEKTVKRAATSIQVSEKKGVSFSPNFSDFLARVCNGEVSPWAEPKYPVYWPKTAQLRVKT